MTHKDPEIVAYEELNKSKVNITKGKENSNIEDMLAIELNNFVKHRFTKTKTTTSFQPFKIRQKTVKINEYFSLKILDQASIYLIFKDGNRKFKLDIGMILDHTHIIDTRVMEVEVMTKLETYPACTESIDSLQRKLDNAHHIEQLFKDRQKRVKRPAPNPAASVEHLKSAISKPLRSPIEKVHVTEKVCNCNFT